jgi:protoporphyrinogen oxidase
LKVVILGGGLSGLATALCAAEDPANEVVVLERSGALGGLAGSFERDGRFYPLGYHHILHRDLTLQYFLRQIGALDRVEWRRIRMFFRVDGRLFDLANPKDFLAFPMSLPDKARFAGLMARAFLKTDWSDWTDRSATELLDTWASPGVRKALFEPLTRLKFDLPCDDVSAAWLGARLHHREGSAALGYIPGANWTKVLCDGVAQLVSKAGVRARTGAQVASIGAEGGRVRAVVLASGETLEADAVVSTVPTETYAALAPGDDTPHLRDIRYSALISVIFASKKRVTPDFYWMNLASLDRAACGVFLLNSLNPSIGAPGDSCVNFVTHLRGRDRPFFARTDAELVDLYLDDFRQIFGFDLDPFWTNVARVPMYSPVLTRGYRNVPLRSTAFSNVWFAGNYRSFPSIVSTGTALRSGLETGAALLAEAGRSSQWATRAATFQR